tara:strand:+ start:27 stop:1127 length:1101 start_codon:yes stop_codon:yes gene_type:complete
MASARARLGAARRGIISGQKKTDISSGILGTLGTIASFGITQAEKSATAWGEYEKGYTELGGKDFQRPKFGEKGFFKGPEGQVRIGEKMYDRGNIRKAGAFLGSEAGAYGFLGDDKEGSMRSRYLEQVAPGTLVTGENLGDYLQEEEQAKLADSGSIYDTAPRKVPESMENITFPGYRGQKPLLHESKFQDFQKELRFRRGEQTDAPYIKRYRKSNIIWPEGYEDQQKAYQKTQQQNPSVAEADIPSLMPKQEKGKVGGFLKKLGQTLMPGGEKGFFGGGSSPSGGGSSPSGGGSSPYKSAYETYNDPNMASNLQQTYNLIETGELPSYWNPAHAEMMKNKSPQQRASTLGTDYSAYETYIQGRKK